MEPDMKNRLTAKQVAAAKETICDGEGLWLRVTKQGRKTWVFRFTKPGPTVDSKGKVTHTGFGAYPEVSLAEARAKRDEAQKLLKNKINPIIAKRAPQIDLSKKITFGQVADELLNSKIWTSEVNKVQWQRSLHVYSKSMWDVPIDEVNTDHVLAVLQPIWGKSETANKVRLHLEACLSYAKARKWFSGENPAVWRGHLQHLLSKRPAAVNHHKALPYQNIPAFMMQLREQHESITALALEFCILTATRINETLGAKWKEVDLSQKLWIIPASRMKTKKEHRVPLCPHAVQILTKMGNIGLGEFIFPGIKIGCQLSDRAFAKLMSRMHVDTTTHGFRSTFKDWSMEETDHANEISEMALAHAVPSTVERAYRRGDLLEKRRALMQDWGKYCNGDVQ
jgi:integrase